MATKRRPIPKSHLQLFVRLLELNTCQLSSLWHTLEGQEGPESSQRRAFPFQCSRLTINTFLEESPYAGALGLILAVKCIMSLIADIDGLYQ